MKRNEIEEKYKWDLSKMYLSKDAFMKDFQDVKNEIKNIEKYKEKFLESSDIFIEFMNLLENINRKVEKMYTYTHMADDIETENSDMQSKNDSI